MQADLRTLHELDTRLLRLENIKIPPVWFEQKVADIQADVTCLKATVQRLELLLMQNQILLKEHVKNDVSESEAEKQEGDVSCLAGYSKNVQ